MEKLLSIEDLVEILGVTKATIYSWTSQNKIPHIKLSKRLLKFKEKDILKWLDRKSVSTDFSHLSQVSRKVRHPKVSHNSHDDNIEKIISDVKKKILI